MYYIIELQSNEDGTSGITTFSNSDKNQALSKFHEILMYAAVSSVYIHTVLVINEEGRIIAKNSFRHSIQPEPEPEPEQTMQSEEITNGFA